MNCSSNYRGIALCNALCKVIDLWLLCKLENKLGTSELQFGFKLDHSTIMCTSVSKEILSKYRRKGSNVYVCLIDASKAFDRINFHKLFTILKSCNISACLVLVDTRLSPTIALWCLDVRSMVLHWASS